MDRAARIYWKLHGSKMKSWRNYRLYLSRITRFFRNRYIDTITYIDVQDFRKWTERKQSATSANKPHTVLTHIFNQLRRWQALKIIPPVTLPSENPGSLVKKAPLVSRNRILSPREILRLRHISTPDLWDVISMAFNTLLRVKDLKGLSEKNINQATNCLEGIQAKTGKRFSAPINGNVQRLINKASGRKWLLNMVNFRKEFEAMRERSGLPAFQFRDIRRTGARYLLRNGYDLATVQAMLGHTDIRMTQIYVQAENMDKKRASRALGKITA